MLIKNRAEVSLLVGMERKKLETLSLIYLQIEQRINVIPSAMLQLSVQEDLQAALYSNNDLQKCQLGTEISVEVFDDDSRMYIEIFSGIITSSNMTVVKGRATISLTLKHQLVRLDSVIRSRVFSDKTDKEIIQELFSASAIEMKNNVNMNLRHEQRIQYQCSDWMMLRYSLETYGAWLIAQPNSIKIVKPELASQPHHLLEAEDGTLVEEAKWNFSAIDMPANIKLRSWDIDLQSTSSVQAIKPKLGSGALDPGKIKKLNNNFWEWGYGSSLSNEELKLVADRHMSMLWLRCTNGRYTVQGSMRYQLGQTLQLSGFGTCFDGAGIITGLKHTITASKWTTSVLLGEDGIGSIAPHFPQLTGLQTAVVAVYDNDDPKKLYRIRIHLNAMDSDKNKNQMWARFAMPYATKESSFFCYPEPGDEVVVGFFEDNPSYPVILGAMHNPERAPALKPSSNNGLKGWVIGDMKLIINSKDKSLILQAGESSVVTLKKDEVIIKSNKIDLTN